MDAWTPIIAIMAALLLGAMSPGPSFIVVARNTVRSSRRHGVATALGMGVGGVIFCSMALAGLYALLASIAWLYLAAKVIGGCYLLHLAWRMWQGASKPLGLNVGPLGSADTLLKSFWMGLSTQVSNPKTALVYGSIFVSLLPRSAPFWCYPVLILATFAVEAGWYCTVALVFSNEVPKAFYSNAKSIIDRAAALTLGTLGLKLMLTSSKAGY
ncbi:LysE family translocator [Pseudomonas typographi]|uniref:LysE family translocator n=1 Tax=Pseudomonas typographi TaxID=2715964 RepID=A0ABR7Z1J8_9PSED|nr:LysE family translocator [Pseudomonas typographi]MBD1587543.1 LysE family translocator [Pseudomonas typographi]MBD1599374.1 LysE family translocator [Pseudomonas typographi]